MSKIVLCDTIHHATPILLEWYYGLYDLGYDVLYLPIPDHSILEIDEEVDILIYAGIPDSVEYLKLYTLKIIYSRGSIYICLITASILSISFLFISIVQDTHTILL